MNILSHIFDKMYILKIHLGLTLNLSRNYEMKKTKYN
jgi:hypothetical protein